MLLALFYAPSAATAWASVAFIQDQLTAGWFVRGLHSFGSSALIVVAALHLLQVLICGRLPAPARAELDGGAGHAGAGAGVRRITGYGLPWDQKGYWAKLVEAGVAGRSAAGGRRCSRSVAQGGGGLRQLHRHAPLRRARVRCCPAAMLVLVALHMSLVRRHRLTPRWTLQRRRGRHAPASRISRDQALRDALGVDARDRWRWSAFVLAFRGAALEAPADSDQRATWRGLSGMRCRCTSCAMLLRGAAGADRHHGASRGSPPGCWRRCRSSTAAAGPPTARRRLPVMTDLALVAGRAGRPGGDAARRRTPRDPAFAAPPPTGDRGGGRRRGTLAGPRGAARGRNGGLAQRSRRSRRARCSTTAAPAATRSTGEGGGEGPDLRELQLAAPG